jgi:hypothetical protein
VGLQSAETIKFYFRIQASAGGLFSLQGRRVRNDDYGILVVDLLHNFAQVAHVEPLTAAG